MVLVSDKPTNSLVLTSLIVMVMHFLHTGRKRHPLSGTEEPMITFDFITKSAEKPRHSCRGWIGVGRVGLNAQAPNKTHAVPEPLNGRGRSRGGSPGIHAGEDVPAVGFCVAGDPKVTRHES